LKPETLFQDALLAQQSGDVEKALDSFGQLLLRNHQSAGIWVLRGLLEDKCGRSFNALWHFFRAIDIEPRRQDAWANAGIVATKLGKYDDAEDYLKRADSLGESFETAQNLAVLYARMMKLEKAEQYFRKALGYRPNDFVVHDTLGQVLIAQGRWVEGWKERQWRHKGMYPPPARQKYPAWDGCSLDGKKILLYPEGGYGDEIYGLRYAPYLAQRYDALVYLETTAQVHCIARGSLSDDVVVLHRNEEPKVKPDYCCSLLDVPYWCGVTPDSVPYERGYLQAKGSGRLTAKSDFTVGLCWRSGKNVAQPWADQIAHLNSNRPLQPWIDRVAKAKSVPLESLRRLFDVQGVRFVSLQLDASDAVLERKLGIAEMPDVEDFADTAELIAGTDLIISVDTSVSHLAGALGHPVWTLVRFDEVTAYPPGARHYESMTFYRQDTPHDWSGTINKLTRDLAKLAAARIAA
jgi:tetratricopeptide (TPR) repeat protein